MDVRFPEDDNRGMSSALVDANCRFSTGEADFVDTDEDRDKMGIFVNDSDVVVIEVLCDFVDVVEVCDVTVLVDDEFKEIDDIEVVEFI